VVSLVLVSHSAPLLDALLQMIEDGIEHHPTVELAGGTDDGRYGTSLRRVGAALTAADGPDGTIVLYDSGSAWLTISYAPLVEGAMVAAARAGQEAPLTEVLEAASQALMTEKRPADAMGERSAGPAAN